MKKAIVILVAALTAMLLIASSAALSYNDVQMAISNEAEASNVIADMDTNGLISASDITSSYKAYRMGANDLAALADLKTAAVDLNGYDVYWHLVSRDGSVALLKKTDNKWKAIGTSVPQKNVRDTMPADLTAKAPQINAGLAGLGADASFIACIEVPDYHTTFLLLSDNGGLSVMPFGSRPDLTELENGKVYSLNTALDILSKSMPLSQIGGDLYGGAGEAAPVQQSKLLTAIIASAAILVIIVSFAAVMVVRSRSKRAQAGI